MRHSEEGLLGDEFPSASMARARVRQEKKMFISFIDHRREGTGHLTSPAPRIAGTAGFRCVPPAGRSIDIIGTGKMNGSKRDRKRDESKAYKERGRVRETEQKSDTGAVMQDR